MYFEIYIRRKRRRCKNTDEDMAATIETNEVLAMQSVTTTEQSEVFPIQNVTTTEESEVFPIQNVCLEPEKLMEVFVLATHSRLGAESKASSLCQNLLQIIWGNLYDSFYVFVTPPVSPGSAYVMPGKPQKAQHQSATVQPSEEGDKSSVRKKILGSGESDDVHHHLALTMLLTPSNMAVLNAPLSMDT